MPPVYVAGHKNPDADSIGSAIGYAELKSQVDPDTEYVPVRLGELNPQTRWALDRAGAGEPELLPHIELRVLDLMRPTFAQVRPEDAIGDAGAAIEGSDCDLVPVTGDDGALIGAVTARGLARGWIAGLALASPCRDVLEAEPLVATAEELISEVAEQIRASHAGAAIVVDEERHPIGLLSRAELVSPTPRRVLLVDHAERGQSVAGVEHAEIVEILDHHHIGSIETRVPIPAVFDPIGSTATLVAERFRLAGIEPTAPTATMLLAGVLSDTVILNSPTTTDRDAAVVGQLGEILGLDPRELGREMFEASSDVSAIPAEELVRRDAKSYQASSGLPFLIAQVEVVGKTLADRKQELLAAIREERARHGAGLYALMVTDVLDKETDLLVDGDLASVARAFGVQPSEGSLLLPGVMSRKKQVAPKLLSAL